MDRDVAVFYHQHVAADAAPARTTFVRDAALRERAKQAHLFELHLFIIQHATDREFIVARSQPRIFVGETMTMEA